MIDTHCHLSDSRLLWQLNEVLARAAAAGVSRMITIGTDVLDSEQCLAVCREHPQVRCAVGVHPNHVADMEEHELPRLRQLQADPAVVAIGEAGLDYHYGTQSRQKQFLFFEHQLQLAVEVNKPVVIHCREAMADCLGILRNFPAVRAIFHCFTGTAAEAQQVLDGGYLLGFTGIITYKNCGELQTVVRTVPADRFVVETDAPWLSPEPMRKQKLNEPALVMHTARRVAELRAISPRELDEQTSATAAAFFGWPLANVSAFA